MRQSLWDDVAFHTAPPRKLRNRHAVRCNITVNISEMKRARAMVAGSYSYRRREKVWQFPANSKVIKDALPKFGVFTVLGTTGVLRVVTLVPRESCSRPASNRCYPQWKCRLHIPIRPLYTLGLCCTVWPQYTTRQKNDRQSGWNRSPM